MEARDGAVVRYGGDTKGKRTWKSGTGGQCDVCRPACDIEQWDVGVTGSAFA
jgi:hypothetical protein